MSNRNSMLIVDDIEMNRVVLGNYFCDDFSILYACDGNETIRCIEKHAEQIAIILLDIVMPNMDGIEVLKWISNSKYKNIPVVAITAEERYQLEALENGAWDFIGKPSDKKIIKARVNNVIGRYGYVKEQEIVKNLEKAKLKMDNLVNSVPGGIAIYKRTANDFETIYFTDGVAELSGYSREEYIEWTKKDTFHAVYEQDRKKLCMAVDEALYKNKPIDENFHINHRNGDLIWVRLNGIVIGEDKGAPIIHAVIQNVSKQDQLYGSLVNETKSAIYVNDADTYELLYMNRSAAGMLEKSEKHFEGKKCYEYLFNRTTPCTFCKIQGMDEHTFKERDFTFPINNRIYHLKGKLMKWNGRHVHLEYIDDITEKKKMELRNMALTEQLSSVIEHIPGGMCLYRYDGKRILPIVHNQSFFELFGYSEEHAQAVSMEATFLNVHIDDLQELQESVGVALRTDGKVQQTYRVYNDKKESYIWVYLNGVAIPQADGDKLIYASYTDVTKERDTQAHLNETQALLSAALQNAHVTVWEYDIHRQCIMQTESSQRIHGFNTIIEHVPESLIEAGHVHPSSIQDFRDLYKEVLLAKEYIQKDVLVQNKNKTDFWWERIIYIPVFDKEGRHIKSIGTSINVTEQKILEQQYKELETLRKTTENGIMINVTANKVDTVYTTMNAINGREMDTLDHFFEQSRLRIPDEVIRKQYDEIYTRENLLRAYTLGKMDQYLETLYDVGNGEYRYLQIHIRLTKDPVNGDIIGYSYMVDIHESKMMQSMIARVIDIGYDYIMCIRVLDESFSTYIGSETDTYIKYGNYSSIVKMLIQENACELEIEACEHNLSLSNVKQALEKEQVYTTYLFMIDDHGERRRKKFNFSYLDTRNEFIILTRTDITDIYNLQMEKNNALSHALEMAKKANTAKTDFLSRMSHDMRTPMNAIIGLSELGEESETLQEVKEYLQKIKNSGTYLLAIINDVLDMSKIETREIKLNPVVVYLPDFIKSTLAIVMQDAINKKIHLEVQQKGISSMYMRIDTTYIQQVTVNLLSNALKFTPEGGQVELILENISRHENFVKNRMIVRDNGVGISEEFLPNVFQPFEQENSANDLNRMGTGLGLAIVQNIVNKMGGMITVNSKKGVGTEFIVEWSFEIASEQEMNTKAEYPAIQNMELSGKHILLVEDHPLNTEISMKLLEKKGMIIEHAQNGQIAIDKFMQSKVGFFDAILMDIRMPVMDGIAATKVIRGLDRFDAKTVPIIATTANAFEEDVQKSLEIGMNAHLGKPIEPKKLYKTLSELINR